MWSSAFVASSQQQQQHHHHPLLTPYLFDTTPLFKKAEEKPANTSSCSQSSTFSSVEGRRRHSASSSFEDQHHHSSGYESSGSSSASTSSSSPLYSLKIFIGGLPKGATKVQVLMNFQKYGVRDIEMQGYLGFCFLIFNSQSSCQSFIRSCVAGECGRHFFPFHQDIFTSKRNMVEVKPFKLVDAHYGDNMEEAVAANAYHPIFVGGIPRDTKAEMLAMKLESKFGHVSEIQIDLDSETLYPRGTAMVVFKHKSSARQAMAAQTMVMKKGKQFCLIELKPFLEIDKACCLCNGIGPSVYCSSCLMTMCSRCFEINHVNLNHKKISRGTYYTLRRC